ncbi:helix-turn-helix domain-containing protein [Leucobacter denitrificans]|uniref:Excisionase family DNA-binding protein n=1 Tax=Leucobacter denitrificans TaxID=683042 RepID=A0A7G9S2E9_9MICO|nr:helix-turn-helix domain-containing protein [Leucobacter denitrificans]QNN62024.1 excisionase family DNA-binding protein [Leucobacter denitrificans]
MIARQSQELQNSVLVSLTVAAESLGVSVKTLRRRISDGTVHGYRVGRLIRVDLDEVRKALVVEIPTVK